MKNSMKQAISKYQKTELGKTARKRYHKSELGKAARKRAMDKYRAKIQANKAKNDLTTK
jgi:DNA-binding PadR family transcriptional regulator